MGDNNVSCDNASCYFWHDGECVYDGNEDITSSPETNADCAACVPDWFEWE